MSSAPRSRASSSAPRRRAASASSAALSMSPPKCSTRARWAQKPAADGVAERCEQLHEQRCGVGLGLWPDQVEELSGEPCFARGPAFAATLVWWRKGGSRGEKSSRWRLPAPPAPHAVHPARPSRAPRRRGRHRRGRPRPSLRGRPRRHGPAPGRAAATRRSARRLLRPRARRPCGRARPRPGSQRPARGPQRSARPTRRTTCRRQAG